MTEIENMNFWRVSLSELYKCNSNIMNLSSETKPEKAEQKDHLSRPFIAGPEYPCSSVSFVLHSCATNV